MTKSTILLGFDGEQEEAYQNALLKQSLRALRAAILFSIFLFIGFAWLDVYIVPEDYWSMWVFRMIYCGYAIVILLYSHTHFFESLHQLVMSSLVIVGAICLLGIMVIPLENQLSNIYYVAFILLMFFSFTLTNIRFWYAVSIASVIVLFYFFTSVFYLDILKNGWLSIEGTIFINNLFFLIMSFLMGAVICAIIEHYRRRDFLQRKDLQKEQEKSNKLLLNILPDPIAEQLKLSTNTIADEHKNVSILFADLVGFTKFASQCTPKDLVNMLDTIFSKFDWLAEKYKLEKIKTIGDAYMVAGGLITENEQHPIAMADMALSMLRELERYNRRFGTKLQLRIGIHIGPVVAGVIGSKKFSYDLWGDAVNVASRMESTSDVGQIQVSKEVYQAVKEKFTLLHRGKVNLKGKGEFDTYFLKG